MRLAVFGATGRLGREILRSAVARGHTVSAHARTPQESKPGVEWITADVANAVDAAHAVILAFGAHQPTDPTFCAQHTLAILEAMRRLHVWRVLCVTGAMVGEYPENRTWSFEHLTRWIHKRYPEQMQDRALQEHLIRSSGMEWTIFKPPRLTMQRAKGEPKAGVDLKVGLLSRISRSDLANLILDEAEHPRFAGTAVFVKT